MFFKCHHLTSCHPPFHGLLIEYCHNVIKFDPFFDYCTHSVRTRYTVINGNCLMYIFSVSNIGFHGIGVLRLYLCYVWTNSLLTKFSQLLPFVICIVWYCIYEHCVVWISQSLTYFTITFITSIFCKSPQTRPTWTLFSRRWVFTFLYVGFIESSSTHLVL